MEEKGKIHLIAIGGAVMHNLALALQEAGYQVTGSDDEIFEPSLNRLAKAGLLPEHMGWFPERITADLDRSYWACMPDLTTRAPGSYQDRTTRHVFS